MVEDNRKERLADPMNPINSNLARSERHIEDPKPDFPDLSIGKIADGLGTIIKTVDQLRNNPPPEVRDQAIKLIERYIEDVTLFIRKYDQPATKLVKQALSGEAKSPTGYVTSIHLGPDYVGIAKRLLDNVVKGTIPSPEELDITARYGNVGPFFKNQYEKTK